MNHVGYEAMAIGNHEFDDGPDGLAALMQGLDFPIVSSNTDVSAEPLLADEVSLYEIITVDGRKVGIVGTTTTETAILSSPGDNVTFIDEVVALEAAVDSCEAAGANVIICLSHSGYYRDKEVAAAVSGVDVIIGGHSHTYLSNTDESAEGEYPTVINSPASEPVLIVQAKAWNEYLGDLKVTFDDNGVATYWSGEPIHTITGIPGDQIVKGIVDNREAQLEVYTSTVVGETSVMLDGERNNVRYGETNLGNLICDAILWQTQAEGVQIALANGGGIRSSIEVGEITMEDILTVLPFGNTVATFGLSGAKLKEALENSVYNAASPDEGSSGRFLQCAGMKYTWDPAQPQGSRITEVLVDNGEGVYVAVEDDTIYKIAANNYIRNGGDGYDVFSVDAVNPYDFGPIQADVVTNYITSHSPVAPATEGRITKLDAE